MANQHVGESRDPLVAAISIFGGEYEFLLVDLALYLSVRPALRPTAFLPIALTKWVELAQRSDRLWHS